MEIFTNKTNDMVEKRISELYTKLHEEDLYYDIFKVCSNVIGVEVEFGDWKHDHAYLDYIMSELGYNKIEEKITMEDGSDCYSSIHLYAF